MEHTNGEEMALRSLIRDVKCLKLAANRGQKDAQLRYGQCMLFSLGVPHNYSEAIRYLEMAAKQGLEKAQDL